MATLRAGRFITDDILLRLGFLLLEKDSLRSRRRSSFVLLLRFARFMLVGDILAEKVKTVLLLAAFYYLERMNLCLDLLVNFCEDYVQVLRTHGFNPS